jgi:hypothetical protein
LAEKTPRTHFQKSKWTYDVPEGEKPKKRWNEPDNEESIVAMFGSVKAKVAKEKERERQYEERIRKFEETKKLEAAGVLPSSRTCRSVRESGRSAGETGRSESWETSRSAMPGITEGSETGRYPTDRPLTEREMSLANIPVAAMMTMQLDHPEILAKMRAERAAKFVGTLKNPLEPPDKASMSSRGNFRPGGSLKHNEAILNKTSTKGGKTKPPPATIVVSARDVDTARMKESLGNLVAALEDTDQQIARQNLKIALAKKVKTFDKKGK